MARTAVIDYFTSPDQRRLDKVFDWEIEYTLRYVLDTPIAFPLAAC